MQLSVMLCSLVCFLVPTLVVGQIQGDNHKSEGDEQERVIALDLINRGQTLVTTLDHLLTGLRAMGHQHLIGSLEHELSLIREISAELQNPHLSQPTYKQWLNYVHHLEEQLLYHENRVAEECVSLQTILHPSEEEQTNSTTTPSPLTVYELNATIHRLVHKGEEAIRLYPKRAIEVAAIKVELRELSTLANHLSLPRTYSAAELTVIGQQLQRHELTLNSLLVRIAKQKLRFK